MQVETDERGVYSHGTRALPGYVRSIIKGEINPKPAPRVLTEAPATALIDADNSLGHVAGEYAMKMAIEKADATGFAAVAVRKQQPLRRGHLLRHDGVTGQDDWLQHHQEPVWYHTVAPPVFWGIPPSLMLFLPE